MQLTLHIRLFAFLAALDRDIESVQDLSFRQYQGNGQSDYDEGAEAAVGDILQNQPVVIDSQTIDDNEKGCGYEGK